MRGLKKTWLILTVGAISAIVALTWINFNSSEPEKEVKAVPQQKARRMKAPGVKKESNAEKPRMAGLSADELFSAEMDKAVQNEDFEAAKRLAEKALRSDNAEVRADAVAMLGWFGDRALPELTAFLSDQDESVRKESVFQWRTALEGMDDDEQKGNIVLLTAKSLTDSETIDDVIGELVRMDEDVAVKVLNDVMRNGTKAQIAKARETYEFITGKSVEE